VGVVAVVALMSGSGCNCTGPDECGSGIECAAGVPLVVPAVSPAPEPYNGQFVQMDVVSISRVP
jgi:hypothetical protein